MVQDSVVEHGCFFLLVCALEVFDVFSFRFEDSLPLFFELLSADEGAISYTSCDVKHA